MAAERGGRGRGRDRDEEEYLDPADVPDSLLDLVEFMARGMATRPDDVVVEVAEGETRPVIELTVHPEDLGHIIGRHGRTAKAMRLMVNAAATKADVRVALDILDTDEQGPPEDDEEHGDEPYDEDEDEGDFDDDDDDRYDED